LADIVFAFDPALDRPIPRLEGVPPPVADAVTAAPWQALESAAAAARESEACLLVLFGRILDPQRTSPAQAAVLRSLVAGLAVQGCRTAWLAPDRAACNDVSRMLGDPAGLLFATPDDPLRLNVRGIAVELLSTQGLTALTSLRTSDDVTGADVSHTRRIVVGWDAAHWTSERWDGDDAAVDGHRPAIGPAHRASFSVWGSRRRRAHEVGVHHLPALQARSGHEAGAGACGLLTLLDHPPADDGVALADRRDLHESQADWRNSWRELPTHHVAWHTLTIPSATGGDEELATAIWSALEGLTTDPHGPLQVIRCHVECGTSVARRVRIAEIAAETLARVRQLFDARTFRAWCNELLADPGESLVAMCHNRSGAKPGSTTSFSTALADICTRIEESRLPGVPADMAREAAWLALELIEST
jgi:hypothetical protein